MHPSLEELEPERAARIRADRARNAHEAGLDAFLRQARMRSPPTSHDPTLIWPSHPGRCARWTRARASTRRCAAWMSVACRHPEPMFEPGMSRNEQVPPFWPAAQALAPAPRQVLVLHGTDDELAPLAEAERAAAAAGASGELRELERTGHLALLERPREVAAAIAAWWRRVGRRARAAPPAAADDPAAASAPALTVPMSYCVPPAGEEQIGLAADKVADPGLPVFSFYRQHGRWPVELEPQVRCRPWWAREPLTPPLRTDHHAHLRAAGAARALRGGRRRPLRAARAQRAHRDARAPPRHARLRGAPPPVIM